MCSAFLLRFVGLWDLSSPSPSPSPAPPPSSPTAPVHLWLTKMRLDRIGYDMMVLGGVVRLCTEFAGVCGSTVSFVLFLCDSEQERCVVVYVNNR